MRGAQLSKGAALDFAPNEEQALARKRQEGVVAAQNFESSGVDGVAFRNTSNGKLARRSAGDRLQE